MKNTRFSSFLRKYNKKLTKKMILDFGRVHFTVAKKPTAAEKKVDALLKKHLAGYWGVIAHSILTALKGDFVALMARRRRK